MRPQVKYRYALNANNELIEIKAAHELGGIYHCPECGQQMIYKCGTKKAWHFAHEKVECDYNHYLHTIAEQRIFEWFNAATEVPMVLQINEVCESMVKCNFYREEFCCRSGLSDVFNLKDYYGNCEKEIRYEKNGRAYVADLLCFPKNVNHDPLFIEICVTHPCEEEKIASGIRIIEFVIKSEEDIDEIIGKQIIQSDKVRLYNFHAKDKLSSKNRFEQALLQKFILFPSKKGFLKPIHCSELNSRRGDMEITTLYNDYVPVFEGDGGFFSVAYAIAFQYDNAIKHCCLCKYHVYDDREGHGICRPYKKFGTNKESSGNDAQRCRFFRISHEFIQSKQKEFDSYCCRNSVEIWLKNS